MRALLVYPPFPDSFWSFNKILKLIKRKVLQPPLGLLTVAALLPREWELKLVDCNIRPIKEEEWHWAEMVLISAMIVQKPGFFELVEEAKQRGKLVAVGGPYPTSLPEEAQAAGADYLVLDEGEITLPEFVQAVAEGKKKRIFRAYGAKADITRTPIPRFDLLEADAYDAMSIQFSRGCPYKCEFCDIPSLMGRKPRTKRPEQILAELDYLFDLGWRRGLAFVDDNFLSNKHQARELLNALKTWQAEHQYPFWFDTETSLDLAGEPEIMHLMKECEFGSVFLGIETPDEESLKKMGKMQNVTLAPQDAVERITKAGLRPIAAFILGFDGEKAGADSRIIDFVERTAIPTVFLSLLQALPNTALYKRLEKQDRLLESKSYITQTMVMNFTPSRPLEEIVREYTHTFLELYDPHIFLDRTYRCFSKLGPPKVKAPFKFPTLIELRAFLIVLWRQGIRRKTRWKFWHHFFGMLKTNPAVWGHYITVCAHIEHFLEYRQFVKEKIANQLARKEL